jgi:hypothetical protein
MKPETEQAIKEIHEGQKDFSLRLRRLTELYVKQSTTAWDELKRVKQS